MADEQVEDWPRETVPNVDDLFMRVHRSYIQQGELIPGVFRDRGSSMSTDWSKYSTPAETRQRARLPNENSVIALNAGEVRQIRDLTVSHSPVPGNRSHTDVLGEKDAEVRLKLLRIFKWALS